MGIITCIFRQDRRGTADGEVDPQPRGAGREGVPPVPHLLQVVRGAPAQAHALSPPHLQVGR